jgi:aminoglycoside phosphotransferase (APT) family kinase protein
VAQSDANASRDGLSAAVLARVPGLEQGGAPLAVSRLSGGTVNRSRLVRTARGAFVVRAGGAHAARDEEDRRREIWLHTAAAAAGLAPRVVWSDASDGVLITEYAPGRVWSAADMAEAQQLVRLGERLRALHALPPLAIEPFDAAATARRYRDGILATDAADAGQLDAWVEEAAKVELRLHAEGRTPTLIHGDLHASNVIDGEQLMLVDWEYGGLADPLYDVACILAYEPVARPHAPTLLAAAGLALLAGAESVAGATRLYKLLSLLWARAAWQGKPSGAGFGESAD